MPSIACSFVSFIHLSWSVCFIPQALLDVSSISVRRLITHSLCWSFAWCVWGGGRCCLCSVLIIQLSQVIGQYLDKMKYGAKVTICAACIADFMQVPLPITACFLFLLRRTSWTAISNATDGLKCLPHLLFRYSGTLLQKEVPMTWFRFWKPASCMMWSRRTCRILLAVGNTGFSANSVMLYKLEGFSIRRLQQFEDRLDNKFMCLDSLDQKVSSFNDKNRKPSRANLPFLLLKIPKPLNCLSLRGQHALTCVIHWSMMCLKRFQVWSLGLIKKIWILWWIRWSQNFAQCWCWGPALIHHA